MPGYISGVYAALLALLLMVLSINVIRLRWRHQVGIQDAGHKDLALAIRVQGNFIEYVPIALILLFFDEAVKYPAWSIHVLGAALLIGRIAHAWGLLQSERRTVGRTLGVTLTFSVIFTAAFMALPRAFAGMGL